MWIDSHCHLTHEKMESSAEELVQRAEHAGVDGMLNISCQITGDFPGVLGCAQKFDNVWCSIGTHPHDAGLDAEKAITQEKLVEMARSDPKIIGIGESGLDYYYDNSPREDQQDSFRKHIRACIETDLPLIIHAREADDDVFAIVREESSGKALGGVMHCFSSGPQLAENMLGLGFYISFSGIVTFNKADELREIARNVPLDRILVETDAPYLAPQPHRGKANEPAFVVHTGAFLAALKGVSDDEMARATTENFYSLFRWQNKLAFP